MQDKLSAMIDPTEFFSKEDIDLVQNQKRPEVVSKTADENSQDPPVKGSGAHLLNTGYFSLKDFEGLGNPIPGMAAYGLSKQISTAAEQVYAPDSFGASKLDRKINYASQLENLDDMRGQLQPLSDKLGNTAAKFIGGTLINGIGGLAAGGAGLYEFAKTKDKSKIWNASIAHSFDNMSEEMQEMFPHYYMEADRQKSLWDQAFTYNFWGDEFVNGLSFMSGAMLTGVLTGYVGTAASLVGGTALRGASMAARAANVNKMFNVAREAGYARAMTMEGAKTIGAASTLASTGRVLGETVRQLAYITTGAVYESGLEARHAYDTVKEGLLQELAGDRITQQEKGLGRPLTEDEKVSLLSPREREMIEERATSAGNYNFLANMGLVGMGNLISLSRLYGADRLMRKAGIKGSYAESKLGEFLTTGKKAISLENAARTIGAGKWLLRAGYEGFIEEGGQGIVSRYAENYVTNAVYTDPDGKTYIKDYLEDLGQNFASASSGYFDRDNLKEVVIGSLIGGMGAPSKWGGPGMAWAGSVAETRKVLTADADLKSWMEKTDSVIRKKIEEDKERNPEKYLNQKHNAVLYHLLTNRAKAREAAEKAGDDAMLRKLDSDDLFDKFFAMAETGQLDNAGKKFETELRALRKTDPNNFKELFNLPRDASEEVIDSKITEILSDLNAEVGKFQEARDLVDRTFPQLREERYTGIDDTRSEAWRRRVLIYSAARAESTDAREKALIEELAQITNGTVESQKGFVDEIVYMGSDGQPRRARIGTMNIEDTVGKQLLETSARIAQLSSKRNRTVKEQEDLDNLTELKKRFDTVSPSSYNKPVYSFLLEAKNNKEADTLGKWAAEDPINKMRSIPEQKEKVQRAENILAELRDLRAARIDFNNMFLQASEPGTYAETMKVAAREVEKTIKTANKKIEKFNKERESAMGDFKAALEKVNAEGLEDLKKRLEDLKMDLVKAALPLEEKLDKIAGIEKQIQRVEGQITALSAKTGLISDRESLMRKREETYGLSAEDILNPVPQYIRTILDNARKGIWMEVREQSKQIKEASDWLYVEYRRLVDLKNTGQSTMSNKVMDPILLEMERDITLLEEYANFDREQSESVRKLSFKGTANRIQRNYAAKQERLAKRTQKEDLLEQEREKILEPIRQREVTLSELRNDLEKAISDRESILEQMTSVREQVQVTQQELSDMSYALENLGKMDVTFSDMEEFIKNVEESDNMFRDEDDRVNISAVPGTIESAELVRRYYRSLTHLGQDVQGIYQDLTASLKEAEDRLSVFEGNIRAAQELLDGIEQLRQTDPELADQIMSEYGESAREIIERYAPLKDALLAQIQSNKQLLLSIEKDLEVMHDYADIRTVQALQKIFALREEVENERLAAQSNFSVEESEKQLTKEETDELKKDLDSWSLPDFYDVGYYKTVLMSHSDAWKRMKDLQTMQGSSAFSEEDAEELQRMEDIVRFYSWLHEPTEAQKKIGEVPTNTYMRLMAVHRNNINSLPKEIRDAVGTKFYVTEEAIARYAQTVDENLAQQLSKVKTDAEKERLRQEAEEAKKNAPSDEVVLVVVKQNIDKKKNITFNVVTMDGRPLKAPMMDPTWINSKGDLRFSGNPTQGDLDKRTGEYAAFKKSILARTDIPVFSVNGMSMGVENFDRPAQETLIPKEVLTIPTDVETKKTLGVGGIKLFVAVPNQKDAKVIVHDVPTVEGRKATKVARRAGKVDAYDHVTGSLIPMERQTLSERDVNNVSRAFHRMLREYNALQEKGTIGRSLVKDMPIAGAGSPSMINYIMDFVQLQWNPEAENRQYQLDIRLEKNDLHVIFGQDAEKVTIEDFDTKSETYQRFMQFLGTKRYHVYNRTLKRETQSGKKKITEDVTIDRKTGRPIKNVGREWTLYNINEDLSVGSNVQYGNYTEFLLTGYKDERTGKMIAPVMSNAPGKKARELYSESLRKLKGVQAVQPARWGGYLTFKADKSQIASTKNLTMKVGEEVEETVDAAEKVIEQVNEQLELQIGTDIVEATAGMNVSEPVMPLTQEQEDAAKEITRGQLDVLSSIFNAPIEKIEVNEDKGTVNDLGEILSPAESLAEPTTVFTSKANAKIDFENSTVIVQENGKKAVLEFKGAPTQWSELSGDVNLITDTGLQERIMEDLSYLGMDFMRVTQVGNPVFDRTLNEISEEIARAQRMTPLDVAITQSFIGRLDDPAVAQLRGYGDVLLSTLAPGGAIYHEAFHNVSLYILSKKDADTMYRMVRSIPGRTTDYLGNEVNMSDMNDMQAEEWLAEEFRKWMLSGMTRKLGTDVVDTRGVIKRFFDSIRLMMRRLFNLNDQFISDPSMTSIEDVFKGLESGRFLKMVPSARRQVGEDIYMRARPDGMSATAESVMMKSFLNNVMNPSDRLRAKFAQWPSPQVIFEALSIRNIRAVNQETFNRVAPGRMILTSALVNMSEELAALDTRGDVGLDALRNEILELIGDRTAIQNNAPVIGAMFRSHLRNLGIELVTESRLDDELDSAVNNEESTSQTRDQLHDRDLGEQSSYRNWGKETRFILSTLKGEETDVFGMGTLMPLKNIYASLMNTMVTNNVTSINGVIIALENGNKVWERDLADKLKALKSDAETMGDPLALQFISKLGADLRKDRIDPYITTVSNDGTVTGMDPATVSAWQKVSGKWTANLKNKVGKVSYLRYEDGIMKFDPKAQITIKDIFKGTGKELSEFLSSVRRDESLLDVAEEFGIVFSDPERVLRAIRNREVIEVSSKGEELNAREILQSALGNLISEGFSTSEGASNIADMFNRRFSDEQGRANRLARMELALGTQMVEPGYMTADNKLAYSIVDPVHTSFTLKKYSGRDTDGKRILPWNLQSRHTSYAKNSRYLNDTDEFTVRQIAGLRSETQKDLGEKFSKLDIGSMTVAHIQAMIDGFTPALRAADKSTEIAVGFNIFSKSPDSTKQEKYVNEILTGYLEDEMVQVVRTSSKAYEHVKLVDPQNLRFMHGFLEGENLRDKVYELTTSLKKDHPEWTPNKAEKSDQVVRAKVRSWLLSNKEEVEQSFRRGLERDARGIREFLIEKRIVDAADNRQQYFYPYGIDSEYLGLKKDSNGLITSERLDEFALDIAIRHFVGKNELFKTVYGDPALYSDLFKRMGGAASSKIMFDGQVAELYPKFPRWDFKREHAPSGIRYPARMLMLAEPKGVMDPKMYEELKTMVSADVADQYASNEDTETEKADGTVLVLSDLMRVLEAGTGKWNLSQESAFSQMVEGVAPKVRNDKGQSEAGMVPGKYQYFGPSMIGQVAGNTYLKMSTVPLDETLGEFNGKRYVNYMNLLKFLRDNGFDGVVLPSSTKFGKQVDSNQYVPGTGKNGENVYNAPAHPNSEIILDLDYIGLQQQVSNQLKDKVHHAVQAQAVLPMNVFEDGKVLSDEKGKALPGMEEIEKLHTEFNFLRTELVRREFQKLVDDWGIERTLDNRLILSQDAKEKILDMIEEEGTSREVGELVLSSVMELRKVLAEDGSFNLEYFASAKDMERSLFAALNKRIIKPTRRGDMLVQVSEWLYEHVEVDGKMYSSKLGFYRNEEGKRVMEVMMANHMKPLFGNQLNITPEGIRDEDGVLVADLKLLEGIGIRIPTDGIHSIDVIRVKEFLPDHAGPVVVVPHELLRKAGSDFDIDKLTAYLQNYRKGPDGLLRPQRYSASIKEWFEEASVDAEIFLEAVNSALEGDFVTDRMLGNIFGEKYNVNIDPSTERKELLRMRDRAVKEVSKFRRTDENGVLGEPLTFNEWQMMNPDVTLEKLVPKGAIENRMNDIMVKILTAKESAEDFMRPVNMDTIESIAYDKTDGIMVRAGEKLQIPDLRKKSDLHSSTSFQNVQKMAEAAFEGKVTVGPYALAITHHSKSQKAGLRINMDNVPLLYGKMSERPVMRFPGFSGTEVSISLGKVYDMSGKKIADNFSELANASVDNANKFLIHVINAGIDVAGGVSFLVRSGVPLSTMSSFMNQPIVREYLKQKKQNNAAFLKAASSQSDSLTLNAEKIYDAVQSMYKGDPVNIDTLTYSDDLLKPMMEKSLNEMSNVEKGIQQRILTDFLVYTELGNDLTSLVGGQSFDTKPPKSRDHAEIIIMKYRNVLKKNRFVNAEKIIDESYLSPMHMFVEDAGNLFNDVSVLDRYPVFRAAKKKFMEYLIHEDTRMPIEKAAQELEKFRYATLTAILQRVPDKNEIAVRGMVNRLMFGETDGALGQVNLKKVISGMQTGVDMAGLEAAFETGIPTGGTAAAKFQQSTEGDKKTFRKDLAEKYGLKEGKLTRKTGKFGEYDDVYYQRTIDNAQEADGTIWFGNASSPGGNLTLGPIAQKGKPSPLVNPKSKEEIIRWMSKNNIQVLNVAGNREHTNPGIFDTSKNMLKAAFQQIKSPSEAPAVQTGPIGWARRSDNNYEVSTKGDARFSALNAKLKDGRTIEEAYQLDVKGYRTQGNDWKIGKGKAPLKQISKEQSWSEYKNLWKTYLNENPALEKDLRKKSAGKTLTDMFASTDISQARALYELLSEKKSSNIVYTVPTVQSLAQELLAIQLDTNHPLHRNAWINHMIAKVQSVRGVENEENDHLEPVSKSLNGNDQAVLYDAFHEIRNTDPELTRRILGGAVLQGMINSPFEIISMIPGDVFVPWAKDILTQFEADPSKLRLDPEDADNHLLKLYMANQKRNPNIGPRLFASSTSKDKRVSKHPEVLAYTKFIPGKSIGIRKLPGTFELFMKDGNRWKKITTPNTDSLSFLNMVSDPYSVDLEENNENKLDCKDT